jgi:hypothetical protein
MTPNAKLDSDVIENSDARLVTACTYGVDRPRLVSMSRSDYGKGWNPLAGFMTIILPVNVFAIYCMINAVDKSFEALSGTLAVLAFFNGLFTFAYLASNLDRVSNLPAKWKYNITATLDKERGMLTLVRCRLSRLDRVKKTTIRKARFQMTAKTTFSIHLIWYNVFGHEGSGTIPFFVLHIVGLKKKGSDMFTVYAAERQAVVAKMQSIFEACMQDLFPTQTNARGRELAVLRDEALSRADLRGLMAQVDAFDELLTRQASLLFELKQMLERLASTQGTEDASDLAAHVRDDLRKASQLVQDGRPETIDLVLPAVLGTLSTRNEEAIGSKKGTELPVRDHSDAERCIIVLGLEMVRFTTTDMVAASGINLDRVTAILKSLESTGLIKHLHDYVRGDRWYVV